MLREHGWTKTASPVHVRRVSLPGAWPWQELHPRRCQEIIQVGSMIFCFWWFLWITEHLLEIRSPAVFGGQHPAPRRAVCSWMYLCKQGLIWWNRHAGKQLVRVQALLSKKLCWLNEIIYKYCWSKARRIEFHSKREAGALLVGARSRETLSLSG